MRTVENFFLVIDSIENYQPMLERIAKIGYERQILAIVTLAEDVEETEKVLDVDNFKSNQNDFTIVDIRNHSEVNMGLKFENALHFPLPKLRDDVKNIPTDKPIVVHCAGGYRSASGQSIIKND